LDDWIGGEFLLMEVVGWAIPPIPLSGHPVLVAARGEINAVIDPYSGARHPLFVISPLARGGFGGPVLFGGGGLLGVLTQSLVRDAAPPELGYHAALTVQPLWDLLFAKRIFPASNIRFAYAMRHAWGTCG
jgi:hypothetical protein